MTHSTPTTWITICDTCKREDWDAASGRTDGEALAALIESRAQGTAVRTRRTSCLMGCQQGCNVTVQANGKLGYTLGRFDAQDDTAQAIVDWALLHADSTSGQVPYRQWPQPVKGHFVTRHLPLPAEE